MTKQQVEATGVAWSTLARRVRSGSLERVAHGVYRIRGAGTPEHLDLRAAWLQLNPTIPAWERTPSEGVISHRSAASLYNLGHLPADVHEFTLPARRQTRRDDVRIHRGDIPDGSWVTVNGLPTTRPSRIAADLLNAREDPGAVGALIADALRGVYDYPRTVAEAIAPYAAAYGLRRGDGIALLRWLLDLTGDPERESWLAEAARTGAEVGDGRRGAA